MISEGLLVKTTDIFSDQKNIYPFESYCIFKVLYYSLFLCIEKIKNPRVLFVFINFKFSPCHVNFVFLKFIEFILEKN